MQAALRNAVIAAAALAVIGPPAANAGEAKVKNNSYVVTNLVSDLLGTAPSRDPVLQNPWGVAFSPSGSPFWINDNQTGCATLYNGDGTIIETLQVKIPLPGNVVPATDCNLNDPKNPSSPTPAAPTGIVWNGSAAFKVPGTSVQAAFIFDTEDGTIAAWGGGLTPGNQAVLGVDNSQGGTGAVYKGLAVGINIRGQFLFATNFRAGRVEVYDGNFQPAATAGGFQDPNIPAGFAPFGIQNINGDLWVSYALQNATKHDDTSGPGNGFVDVFDTDGNLLMRFAQKGKLNSPWGMARASQAFGPFSGDILIGNFGDGRINVFDSTGKFIDQLKGADGTPITIDGLWTLTLGGGAKSSSDTLYFTAGTNGETDGTFGTIAPAGVNPNP